MNTARSRHFGLPTLLASMCLAGAVLLVGTPAPAPAGQVGTVSRGAIKRAEAAAQREAAESIDRRPLVMIRVWNGSYGPGNPLGLTKGFRDDTAPSVVVDSLNRAYDEGFRRMILHTPTGAPAHAVLSATLEEWWRRSPQWRSSMRQSLRQWKADHPDAVLGVYMGLLRRNGDLPSDAWLARNLWPLIDAGIEIFVFDAAVMPRMRETFRVAQKWLRSRGAKAVMEAYPVDRATGEVDPEWLVDTPMFALERYNDWHDPNGRWTFDHATTEVWIGVGRGEPIEESRLRSQMERGLLPLVYAEAAEERAKALRVAASFD